MLKKHCDRCDGVFEVTDSMGATIGLNTPTNEKWRGAEVAIVFHHLPTSRHVDEERKLQDLCKGCRQEIMHVLMDRLFPR